MFENLSQEQFEQIIDIIIVYKQANPKKNVYLKVKKQLNNEVFLCNGKLFCFRFLNYFLS